MRNYAITLGVSKYASANDLPSCENDAKLMYDFLKSTEKYELLRVPGNTYLEKR